MSVKAAGNGNGSEALLLTVREGAELPRIGFNTTGELGAREETPSMRFGDSGEAGWARLGVSATLVKVLADMVEHAMKRDGEGPGDAVESAPRVGAKGGRPHEGRRIRKG